MSTQISSTALETGAPDGGAEGPSSEEAGIRGGAPVVTAEDLVDGAWLEAMLARVDRSGLALTGEGGFLPVLVKAVLEKWLCQPDLAPG